MNEQLLRGNLSEQDLSKRDPLTQDRSASDPPAGATSHAKERGGHSSRPGSYDVAVPPWTLRGVSLGGVHTAIAVPELGVLFDVGWSSRTFAGIDNLLLSHAHVDHIGALLTFLGVRALSGKTTPLRIFLPAEVVPHVRALLHAASMGQGRELDVTLCGMEPGQTLPLQKDLAVMAHRTLHAVPSLAYRIIRNKEKLRAELVGLPGHAIAARKHAGEPVTESIEENLLGYATDTLIDAVLREPLLLQAETLIMECTHLDERKSVQQVRRRCHIHLDELLHAADAFQNRRLVLMHFSQHYGPKEVVRILRQRAESTFSCPLIPFVPTGGAWPG